MALNPKVSRTGPMYYRALVTKDRRFDGRIYFGVRTTGIYCRPICPARLPRRENVAFFLNAAAAEAAGYRPCKRCRPETGPGTPVWSGTSATVSKALRLIGAGIVEERGLNGLSQILGIGERHLRRLFLSHLGASPSSLVHLRRLDFATKLLADTSLGITAIAFASGFESVRRFNSAFKSRFGRTPSEVRKRGTNGAAPSTRAIRLKMPFRPPFDWVSLHRFLADRVIPGVEWADEHSYARIIGLERGRDKDSKPAVGSFKVTLPPEGNSLLLEIDFPDVNRLMECVNRITQIFDLNADPHSIARVFSKDKFLAPVVKKFPGLRVPGAWDPFELAVRAVLGQQISVAGATTLAKRLVEVCGSNVTSVHLPQLKRAFPTPGQLWRSDFSRIGITQKRVATLKDLAQRVDEGTLKFDPYPDWGKLREQLIQIPGIGEWTAEYIALRALGDPDAFPASDLVIKRELGISGGALEQWRPWRSYAAIYLWKKSSLKPKKIRKEPG